MTRVAAVVGPTAVGKTAVAIEVAKRVGAEIVSLDSMQLYKGMDIGTDKVDVKTRAEVAHHLIDVKEPYQDVTVAEFQQLARSAIEDIARRGRVPLLVGGSGLYYRAVVDDLVFPPTEPALRARLEDEAESLGPERLHERLTELDPAAAARIEVGNARRTVRALEVIELTGRRFSDSDAWDRYESVYELTAVGLLCDRVDLYARIEQRVRVMLDRGLIQETALVADGGMGRTARMALGYRQVLDAPNSSLPELEEAIVRATKRFARRQESWFRADPRITWIDAGATGVVDRVTGLLGASEDVV